LSLASLKLPASGFLPFLVAACALQLPPSPTERPTTAGPSTPVAERGAYLVPIGVQAALAQTKALPGDASGAGLSKDAGQGSDFGVRALQRATRNYAAGDVTAARRSLVEAAEVLASIAASMGAPGRGEVWMLANDVRLLRPVEGGVNPVTLYDLNDAEARASALAGRYADRLGTLPTPRK
jgi:hypothetical protein